LTVHLRRRGRRHGRGARPGCRAPATPIPLPLPPHEAWCPDRLRRCTMACSCPPGAIPTATRSRSLATSASVVGSPRPVDMVRGAGAPQGPW